MSALDIFDLPTVALYSFASDNLAPCKFVLNRVVYDSVAISRLALFKLTASSLAPVKSAPDSSAPEKFTPNKTAWLKQASRKLAFAKFTAPSSTRLKSAPSKFALRPRFP